MYEKPSCTKMPEYAVPDIVHASGFVVGVVVVAVIVLIPVP